MSLFTVDNFPWGKYYCIKSENADVRIAHISTGGNIRWCVAGSCYQDEYRKEIERIAEGIKRDYQVEFKKMDLGTQLYVVTARLNDVERIKFRNRQYPLQTIESTIQYFFDYKA